MDFDSLLTRIKDYYEENRQLILASILSTVVIIGLILVMSFLKNHNTQTNSNNYLFDSSTTKKVSKETETTSKTEESTDDDGLSDLDFTLPEDVTEETETTLEDGEYEYLIKVNRAANCITIYRQDDNGNFSVPYKSMVCSAGRKLDNTPIGTFHTSSKYNWRLMVDGSYAQYATRIYNGILFHSVPCTSASSDALEYEEYNKLGTSASLGCIRLTVADAKWIYDHCSYGTVVEIYDDADNPGPLGKPSAITIPSGSPNKGWDPTDPDPNNPWHKCEPMIEGYDVTIGVGNSLDLMSIIKATDTCGNDITSSVTISGTVNTKKIGKYDVKYSVKDLLGRTASLDVTINVANSASTQVTKSAKKYSPSSGTMPATDASPNLVTGGSAHTNNTTAPYDDDMTTQPTTQAPATQPTTTQHIETPVQTTPNNTTAPNTTTQSPVPAQTTQPTTVAPPETTTPQETSQQTPTETETDKPEPQPVDPDHHDDGDGGDNQSEPE